jgi:urease accessory protein
LLDLQVGAAARVLATTPGAQKWYRSVRRAVASTRLSVAQGAALEWLPQPAIVYDHARIRQSVELEMADDASTIGWEVLVRGRGAMGEALEAGHLDQTLSIAVGRRLLWQERLYADAADRLFGSPLGWSGRRAAATVWCCAPALAAGRLLALRDCWRTLLNGEGAAQEAAPVGGATIAAEGLLLAKLLADDTEQLMARCQALWRAARLSLEGDAGSLPRIWRT